MYTFSFWLAYYPTPNPLPRLLSLVVGIIIHQSLPVRLLSSLVQIFKSDFFSEKKSIRIFNIGLHYFGTYQGNLNVDYVYANSTFFTDTVKSICQLNAKYVNK